MEKIQILLSVIFILGYSSLKADDLYYEAIHFGGSMFSMNRKYTKMTAEVVIYNMPKGMFTTMFIFTNTSDTEQNVITGFLVIPSCSRHFDIIKCNF